MATKRTLKQMIEKHEKDAAYLEAKGRRVCAAREGQARAGREAPRGSRRGRVVNEQTSIVVSEATPLAVAGPASESQQVMDLFRRAFEGGGATPEALAQLVDLKERVDRRNAELEFARALARFQEVPADPAHDAGGLRHQGRRRRQVS